MFNVNDVSLRAYNAHLHVVYVDQGVSTDSPSPNIPGRKGTERYTRLRARVHSDHPRRELQAWMRRCGGHGARARSRWGESTFAVDENKARLMRGDSCDSGNKPRIRGAAVAIPMVILKGTFLSALRTVSFSKSTPLPVKNMCTRHSEWRCRFVHLPAVCSLTEQTNLFTTL
jgi:hypothetical protein